MRDQRSRNARNAAAFSWLTTTSSRAGGVRVAYTAMGALLGAWH